MSTPGISVQLIVFGGRAGSDLDGTLGDVSGAGYDAVEAGNLYRMHGEETVRDLLDKHGLVLSGAHFGYQEFADQDRFDAVVGYVRKAGIRNVMCSGVADASSVEGYRQSAVRFNEAGRILADAGVHLHYHNHDWEFRDLGGINGMQILDAETKPEFVRYNMDVFWLHYAGQDPVRFISDHADRAGYFHFKDGKRLEDAEGKTYPEFLELGQGEVNLPEIMSAVRSTDCSWIVTEQDKTKREPVESITISRAYLRQQLGV